MGKPVVYFMNSKDSNLILKFLITFTNIQLYNSINNQLKVILQ